MASPNNSHLNRGDENSNLDIASTASYTSTSRSGSASPSPELTSDPVFTKFPLLPPELRHQIWRTAILSYPGINFFNMHSIPNDHVGANRSNSPPWLYLDLRRLSIEDDDATVSEYDPSVWQARKTLRQTCREARSLCTLPESEAVPITLIRPKRSLFVRAADGQLRRLTPRDDRSIRREAGPGPEPLERRVISVRADELLCLSVENCSFNLPFEEMSLSDGAGFIGDTYIDAGPDDDLGWSYDPHILPLLPSAIPRSRLCINMARGGRTALRPAQEVLCDMLSYSQDHGFGNVMTRVPLVMFDAYKQELGDRRVEELSPEGEVFWDRFGDRYVKVPWDSTELPADYRLAKVWPESNDIRTRYLRSAMLQSPKRPASLST
ncbi:hypothetical protein F4677DRAFT_310791 [Hypoxylon crocopeplum]|nr:hypothetical protein F4677DRAFT_310791 [Hypoxylon crocopeplum]